MKDIPANLPESQREILDSITRGVTEGIQIAIGKRPRPRNSLRALLNELQDEIDQEDAHE